MMIDVEIEEDQDLWKSRYAARSSCELAAGRMLWASIPHQPQVAHITVSEWEYYRTLYRREAVKLQRELDAYAVVYALAKSGPDGGIGSVEFGILALDEGEYKKFWGENSGQMVYSVFSRSFSPQ